MTKIKSNNANKFDKLTPEQQVIRLANLKAKTDIATEMLLKRMEDASLKTKNSKLIFK